MNKRILVVDDEADFSELLQFRLRNFHYDVVAAATGVEALEKVRQEPPHLILMDLMLPDFDGLTLCEILRRQASTRDTPIIMISAVSTEITRCSARIAGARAFLGKPLAFETLVALLEKLLEPQAAGAADSFVAFGT